MNALKRSLLLLALACAPSAWAVETSFFYSKAQIYVSRHNPPAALPWQSEKSASPNLPLDVEIRNASVIYMQEGWFTFDSPDENHGLLLTFDVPQPASFPAMRHYAPLDILMLNVYGQVVQIIPSVIPAKLDAEIPSPGPVLAFLLIKGGSCERNGIAVGDTVDYRLFKKPPTILNTQPQPAPPAQPAAPPISAATIIAPAAEPAPHTQESAPPAHTNGRFTTRLK